MFIGISVGANVVLGKFIGARDEEIHLKLYIQLFLLPSLVDY